MISIRSRWCSAPIVLVRRFPGERRCAFVARLVAEFGIVQTIKAFACRIARF